MSRFLERLASGPPLVGDGGMGTLVSSAVARLRCPEEANLRAPESVLSLHLGFIRAGADIIETNTFGANRRKLAEHYLEDDVAAINEAAVKIARDAREVSGADVFIAGSIGPLGGPAKDRDAIFAEQAQLLEGRGVDLFMIETFYELDELVTAIGAVRAISSLPIVSLLTFDEDSQTLGGVSAEHAAARARGARRRRDRREPRRSACRRRSARSSGWASSGKPLAALPNVGLASLAGERVIFPHATPEYFAEFAAHARELGARDHRRLLRDDARRRSPRSGTRSTRTAARARSSSCASARSSSPRREPERETLLQRKLREGEFVVSVEIDPPRGGNAHAMLELARALQASGPRRRRRRQRQPARPRAHERAHRLGDHRARRRPRDDPPPHAARRVDRRARVDAARRARRRASATSSPSPATRPRRATIPARAACTRSTRSGSRR